MYQQLFGFVHTNIIQIVDKFLSGLLFEKLAEIASVQVKEGIIEEAEKEDPIVLHGYMSNAG